MASNTFVTPSWLIDATLGRTAITSSLDPRVWDPTIGGDITEQYAGAKVNWLVLAAAKAASDLTNPQTAGLSANQPTIVVATTAPTATFPTQYPTTSTLPNWTAAVDIDGGIPAIVGGNLNFLSFSQAGASSSWVTPTSVRSNGARTSFVFTGTDFAFRTTDNGTNKPHWFRLIVNGQYTSRTGYQASPGTGFAASYVTVTFPTPLVGALVTLETNQDCVLGYFLRRTADTMVKPTYAVARPMLMIVGDSITAGAINDTTTGVTKASPTLTTQPAYSWDSIGNRVADMLGCRRFNSSIGGTGYNAGTSGSTTFNDRLFAGADLATLAPLSDAIVFLGGINDAISVNNATVTRSTIQTRFNLVLAQTAAAFPALPTVVGGNYFNSSFNGSAVNANTEIDLFAAAAAAKGATPAARMVTMPINDIVNGSGAPPTSGNAVAYLNSDGTHPNSAGEAYEAGIVAGRLYTALQAASA